MHGVRRVTMIVAPLVFAAAMAAEESNVALIPVFTWDPLPGVNGSSWTTELWTLNGETVEIGVEGLAWDCFLPLCGVVPIGPGVSYLSGPSGSHTPQGALLRIHAGAPDSVQFNLRFRDQSRQSSTAGTEIPVARNSDFRSEKFSLINVPVEEGFRQTLRIYELDGTEREASVRVSLWRLSPSVGRPNTEPDELLGESTLPLEFTAPEIPGAEYPGYAQITDLSTIASLGDAETVRIEIEPVTEGLRLWAFVTVIHNETQHATVISPQ